MPTNPLKPLFILLLLLQGILSPMSAQTPTDCGTDEINQRLFESSPKMKLREEQFRERMIRQLQAYRANPDDQATRAVLTIPVVFHIMHDPSDGEGSGTNISLARVQTEIDNWNAAYRDTGAYANGPFYTAAANVYGVASQDIEINFCLASVDPRGFPTDGVVRTPVDFASPLWRDDDGIDVGPNRDRDLQALSYWPSDDYFNVWVVDEICKLSDDGITVSNCGVAGYAYFPSAHGQSYDGSIVEDDWIGTSTDYSKIMVHEVGHYLGLYHTFEGGCAETDCTSGGDYICDTPPDNSTAAVSCAATDTVNSCTNDASITNSPFATDVGDMYENYMDYGYQSCQNTFTPEQKAVMRATLNGDRVSLQSAGSCGASAIANVQAAFELASMTVAEAGGTTSDCQTYRDFPIRVVLANDTSVDVTIDFTLSGTTTEDLDFELIGTPITISSGDTYGVATLRVYDDASVEGTETLTLDLVLTNAVAASSYESLTITFSDNDNAVEAGGVFYSEDFESGYNGWTRSCFSCGGFAYTDPNVWVVGGNAGMTGSGAAYPSADPATESYTYDKSGTATFMPILITPAISTSGKTDITMSFDYKVVGETAADYMIMAYNIGGAGWYFYYTPGTFYDQATATTYSGTLESSFEDEASIQFAFVWISDDDGVGTDPPIAIDNFELSTPSTDVAADVNDGLAGESEKYLGPYADVYFYDESTGDIMARIQNNSAYDFGCTTVSVDRSVTSAGGSTVAFSSNTAQEHLASKTFLVTPSNNSTGYSYTFTGYFEESEITAWETATGLSLSDAKWVKYSGPIDDVTPANSLGYSATKTDLDSYPGSPNYGSNGYALSATFTTGFSGFGLGNPNLATLPIEGLSVAAEQVEQGVNISWQTQVERNTAWFEVEHRPSGTEVFQPLGTVEAAGFSSYPRSYQWIHGSPIPGWNDYRLTTTDLNGNTGTSEVAYVNISEISSWQVAPIPASEKVAFSCPGDRGTVQLLLTNLQGQVIRQQQWTHSGGEGYQLDISELASGIYLYQLTDESGVSHGRIVRE